MNKSMKSLIACSALALMMCGVEGMKDADGPKIEKVDETKQNFIPIFISAKYNGNDVIALDTLVPNPNNRNESYAGEAFPNGTWMHHCIKSSMPPSIYLDSGLTNNGKLIIGRLSTKGGYRPCLLINDNTELNITIDVVLRQWVNIPDEKGRTPVHEAVSGAHFIILSELLDHGADLNFKDNNGQTPMHLAACFPLTFLSGQKSTVNRLMESHPDLTIQDNDGNTPAHIAAQEGNNEMLQWFLSTFTDPEQKKSILGMKNKKGQTLLHLAVLLPPEKTLGITSKRRDVLSTLLNETNSLKELLDQQDDEGRTPLYLSMEQNDLTAAEMLINAGANPNILDKRGDNPFHVEIKKIIDMVNSGEKPDFKKAEWLLTHGADINFFDANGNAAVHIAAGEGTDSKGNALVIQWLLGYGQPTASTKFPFFKQKTSTKTDSNINSNNKIEPSTVSIDMKNQNGETPLFVALKTNHLDLANWLLDVGASTDEVNNDNFTVLHLTANINETVLFENILKASKNPLKLLHSADKKGNNPFISVVTHNNVAEAEIIAKYITNKSSLSRFINLCNTDGETPLILAVYNNHVEIAKWLMSHGADPNIPEFIHGTSPITLAQNGKNALMLEVLGDSSNDFRQNFYLGYDFSSDDDSSSDDDISSNDHKPHEVKSKKVFKPSRVKGETELMQKIKASPSTENVKSIGKLLRTGSDPNIVDNDGLSALFYALDKVGKEDVASVNNLVELLLNNRANPNSEFYFNLKISPLAVISLKLPELAEQGKLDDGINLIKLLLQRGANPKASFSLSGSPLGENYTVLHIMMNSFPKLANQGKAIEGLKLIELLLQRRADPNAKNAVGDAPIHLAIQAVKEMPENIGLQLINLLLKYGAKSDLKNDSFIRKRNDEKIETPTEIAKRTLRSDSPIIKLLSQGHNVSLDLPQDPQPSTSTPEKKSFLSGFGFFKKK